MSTPDNGVAAAREHDDHDDFGGFGRDLGRLFTRRRALATAATVGGSLAVGGRLAAQRLATTVPAGEITWATASSGDEIADETQGPYPADGSNGPNVLTDSGIVRADITTSVGEFSGTADGVPLQVALTVVDNETGAAVPGAAIYLWHCTADGKYSIYEIEDQNYLRGVQAADDAGHVLFDTIFAGCYAGRWPHLHFEVYTSIDDATAGSQAVKTSQLALPQSDCEAVYADGRYADSAGNLSRLSLTTDGIFADGWQDQLATVTGSPTTGYVATLLVRI